ncbi:GATA transcription factor 18 [Striga hermonthica]|uniref:GATA transcription factor 18 n=1 Tax=Striga hermonthica TaxID=68872 RepID=A0A9N7N1A1_STRHE|nr:GATA transcription factor 18 [Striga hermonthica]
MLFSMGYEEEAGEMYSSFASSSPASVDCTLSLGTPSTRVYNHNQRSSCTRNNNNNNNNMPMPMPSSAFGWNILPSKHSHSHTPKPHRHDPLLARRCANCDTTSTPLWRNGPRGPKSLCNACGIRFKKEERRATAAAAHGETTWPQTTAAPCYSSSPYAGNQEFRFVTFVD